MNITWSTLGFVALLLLTLLAWRQVDRRTDKNTWRELLEISDPPHALFDLTMIEELPEPAQRYFRYTIEPGTPLVVAVEIDTHGEICLGNKQQPKCIAMTARQLLAPPHGLVWRLDANWISGSDGATPMTSWTRFWLFGFIPVVRVGGNADHHRSAFGRVVAEGAFWVPAGLLPSRFVRWESVNQSAARAVVTYAKFTQAVELYIADDGHPEKVVISRWSNENPEKQYRAQPFGGELSEFKEFKGYTLPTRITGGNHINTEEYFPFYRVTVSSFQFPALRAVK